MIRGVGLRGAIAVNVITMIGIGPLITIPLVLATLHGGLALIGWSVGALIALCDGLVWAELSSRYPGSGGTYVYLREAFGRDRWGRLFAFLFNWQFIFFAPLLLASGYIGFTQYAGYFFPAVASTPWLAAMVKIGLGLLVIALLYQRITSIAKVSIVLGITAVGTLLCVIAAGLPHADAARVLSSDMSPAWNGVFIAALGMALVNTVYDYVGYADVALIGDEVIAPNRTIPLAIICSVLIVAALYLTMQISVLGVVPWQDLIGKNGGPIPDSAQYVAATVVEHTWGRAAAIVVTILVLITAFASLYGNLLGFSRIPFAAARDGIFFPIFGRLHKTGAFPNVSLLIIGFASIGASFLSLGDVINYLTAGIVLIQGVAQVAAVMILRLRHERAPFHMWLFPLPALIALTGWIYVFIFSGNKAMIFGLVTLGLGVAAFAILARVQRVWPFAVALIVALLLLPAPKAEAANFGHSAVVEQNGYPVFEVNGKPFFVYGAAFFYERLPKPLWRPSLTAYKAMGINTIDLYLIWNWHELSDGNFDFTGKTNPRRDLHSLLALIHELGFKTVIRPGPVIRNEWKNGGYPDWLLQRPEYAMPLHEVLEGRYPATATLQNAHSDDAAAEWMNNKTHMRYAQRWLRRALSEIKPWASDVIAIALDDDQAAYIDNQTWPAPHLQAYLKYLESVVHSVAPRVPTFINTYQMKVTASSPVWAWGNWYQSDTYTIGEHDRSQLEFSTGLLQTQPNAPVMASEFQAGWLQGPDETHARGADPANTAMAIGTLIGMGAHGIINFPVQDTINPAGYEAPFANAFYGWDAALGLRVNAQPRYAPTAYAGAQIAKFGSLLAHTHRVADAALVWTPDLSDPATLTNADFYKASAQMIAAQQWCRAQSLTCDLIDARTVKPAALVHYGAIIVPSETAILPQAIQSRAKVVFTHDFTTGDTAAADTLGKQLQTQSAVQNGQGMVTLFQSDRGQQYMALVQNYGDAVVLANVRVRAGGKTIALPALRAAAHTFAIYPVAAANGVSPTLAPNVRATPFDPTSDLPIRADQSLPNAPFHNVRSGAQAYTADIFSEGSQSVVLENSLVRVVISPQAGARAFVFEDKSTGRNIFTSIGAMRDDVAAPSSPSPRDYIAKYTHQFPAGTFNRPYSFTILQTGEKAVVRFAYSAPDLLHGAVLTFTRTVSLESNSRSFEVSLSSASSQNCCMPAIRSISSITVGQPSDFTSHLVTALGSVQDRRVALYDSRSQELATISWTASGFTDGSFELKPTSALSILGFAGTEPAILRYGYFTAQDVTAARTIFDSLKGR